MESKIITQRHLENLGHLVGHKVNGGTSVYQYILSSDDLTNAYLKMRNELGYPLMIDSRYRRAIVYNKKGLENKIQDMINKNMEKVANTMSDLIFKDITYQLNNIITTKNGEMLIGRGNSSSIGNILGKTLGKGLVKGFFTILDEITDKDDYNRRR